jgi:prevent-host-death family protein
MRTRTVTIEEARKQLAELIAEAAGGGMVIIVQENQPVAQLIGMTPASNPDKDRYPLRGSLLRYDDPLEPVCEDDWEALK